MHLFTVWLSLITYNYFSSIFHWLKCTHTDSGASRDIYQLLWIAAADSLLLLSPDWWALFSECQFLPGWSRVCPADTGRSRRQCSGTLSLSLPSTRHQAICMLRWSLQHSDHPFAVLVARWSSIIIAMETDVLLSIGRQKQNSLFPFPLENSLMKTLADFKPMLM